ncbi:sugar-binding domain-containing protein, partial [Escherichia coli]|nr:sugar-binding domain-containing protein [Escherichia coli]
VLLVAQAEDVALLGIGAGRQQDDETIIRSGYISQCEQLMIGRKGAVGDILCYFFYAKVYVVTYNKIHNELIYLPLCTLKFIPV